MKEYQRPKTSKFLFGIICLKTNLKIFIRNNLSQNDLTVLQKSKRKLKMCHKKGFKNIFGHFKAILKDLKPFYREQIGVNGTKALNLHLKAYFS